MTNDEMLDQTNDWFNALDTDEEAQAYEEARTAAQAYGVRDEYWFMKGWVARNA